MLVDDHDVVRAGLRLVLEEDASIAVVAEAATAADAVTGALRSRPDIVLMDVRLANGNGIEATRQIQSQLPEARILMLTTYPDDEALFASIMAGAAGYLLKSVNPATLLGAVHSIARGESLLDPAVTRKVLTRVRESKVLDRDAKLASLTQREEQVLELLATGMTNAQIGQAIHISDKTVKNHVSTILGKLEVDRRTEAAAYVAQHRNPFG
jgi:two-component system, NarL family, response regulator DevR